MSHFEAGRWQPYTREELLELLCLLMPKAPVYTRLSRVIRDIPSIAIHAGNQETNFREVAERTMAKRGLRVQDIRAREVRRGRVSDQSLELRRVEYETTVSRNSSCLSKVETLCLVLSTLSTDRRAHHAGVGRGSDDSRSPCVWSEFDLRGIGG